MTRALLIRNDRKADEYVDALIGLFGDPALAWDAARAIGDIAKEDSVFTKENFAVVKVSTPK